MALDEKRQSDLQQAVLHELERDSVVSPTLPAVVVKALKTLERGGPGPKSRGRSAGRSAYFTLG